MTDPYEGPLEIYVDSNVFISYKKSSEGYRYTYSKKFFNGVLRNLDKFVICTSVFSFLEIAQNLSKKSNAMVARSFVHEIGHSWKPIVLYPARNIDLSRKYDYAVDLPVLLDDVAETAYKYKIRGALDSIHAHTAILNDVSYFVTWNENDFKKLDNKFKLIKVRTPQQFVSEFKTQLGCRA